jgi:hypothetical protein
LIYVASTVARDQPDSTYPDWTSAARTRTGAHEDSKGDRACIHHNRRYPSAMKKPLRCWLTFHDWRMMVNDEGQRYKTCARCGAYRDFDPRPGMA